MTAARPRVGLSLMPDEAFRAAAMPLFEQGLVEALEWTIDLGFAGVPPWVDALLTHYGAAGRLVAHGVAFSPFAGRARPDDARFVDAAEASAQRWSYTRASEHFGFSGGGRFASCAPLSMPQTPGLVAVAVDRLARFGAAMGAPVGIENLAFAFSRDDAVGQGAFVEAILAPKDGHLVLDLHNLHCQIVNFDLDADLHLASFPLARVRELHVSGGSTSMSADGRPVRRDTHDGPVPDAVLDLLARALRRCPHVDTVIVERMGGLMTGDPAEARELADDLVRTRAVVDAAPDPSAPPASTRSAPTAPSRSTGDAPGMQDEDAARMQAALLHALADQPTPTAVVDALRADATLAPFHDFVAAFEPRMVEVAQLLVRRWGQGSARRELSRGGSAR